MSGYGLNALCSFGFVELIYLGDTNVDMMTGKNAGAKLTVGVSWGFRPVSELIESGADVIVDNPIEILDLIK